MGLWRNPNTVREHFACSPATPVVKKAGSGVVQADGERSLRHRALPAADERTAVAIPRVRPPMPEVEDRGLVLGCLGSNYVADLVRLSARREILTSLDLKIVS